MWRSTFREVAILKDAAYERQRQSVREAIAQAWNTAALIRASQTRQGMPALGELIAKFDRPREATMRLKRAAWRDWAITARARGYDVRIRERKA